MSEIIERLTPLLPASASSERPCAARRPRTCAAIRWFSVPFYFGGTSLLIVVGVALDTVRQMESHLLMRNYEGFLKRSRTRSGAFSRT